MDKPNEKAVEAEKAREEPKKEEPKADPKPNTGGGIPVFSEKRKGKSIIGASGQVIVFDNEGRAKVNEIDALYLKSCSGYKVG